MSTRTRSMILGAVVALALPAAAGAQAAAVDAEALAKQSCKTQKSELGTKIFKQTHKAKSTAKAMKACVGATTTAVEEEARNAAQACRAERDADAAAFNEQYGSNNNGRNAFGKCVSSKVRAATEAATEETIAAAESCKAARNADATAFGTAWGTGKNAFGKCVSAAVRAEES